MDRELAVLDYWAGELCRAAEKTHLTWGEYSGDRFEEMKVESSRYMNSSMSRIAVGSALVDFFDAHFYGDLLKIEIDRRRSGSDSSRSTDYFFFPYDGPIDAAEPFLIQYSQYPTLGVSDETVAFPRYGRVYQESPQQFLGSNVTLSDEHQMFAIWMQRWVRHVHDATVADVIEHITAPPEKRTIYHEIEASLPEAERLWFQGRLALELMLRNWMGWCKFDRQFRWVQLWKDELYPGKALGEHETDSDWDEVDVDSLNRHDILKPFDYDVMDRLWGRDGWLMTYAPNATLEGMRLDLIEQGCTLPSGPAPYGAE